MQRVVIQKEIIVPVLHLNGTAPRDLWKQYDEIRSRLHDVKYVMERDSAPHPRDYYVQDTPDREGGSWMRVMDEHADRISRINSVLSEVEAIMEDLVRQDVNGRIRR